MTKVDRLALMMILLFQKKIKHNITCGNEKQKPVLILNLYERVNKLLYYYYYIRHITSSIQNQV